MRTQSIGTAARLLKGSTEDDRPGERRIGGGNIVLRD